MRIDGPQLVLLIRAGQQVPFPIKVETIGSSAGAQECGKIPIDTPFHNSVVRLIGKVDISCPVDGRPFSKFKSVCQFYQSGSWRDHLRAANFA
jgi:hypothetical protein